MNVPDSHHTALNRLMQRERDRFCTTHARSMALSHEAMRHFLFGVPLHWMRDWPSPATLFVRSAQGAKVVCADGIEYSDFCLGDTGAMFGHSPPALVSAMARQLSQGLTCMLPSDFTPCVGEALAERFSLPFWQLAMTASDANRFVLRWARAITGRSTLLVFDGCYHGAVDDTLVDREAATGQSVPRRSVLGQVHNHHQFTRVVPFNDLSALEQALSDGEVAALLAEPALTNFGLVLPDPGFWAEAAALCKRHGTLWILDETHTLSTAPGGYARAHHLSPDFWVAGKAVAGGLPCAVYGFSTEMAERMRTAKEKTPEGHSGIGTTLTANPLTLAALNAALLHLHTPASYAAMQSAADHLERGLLERIRVSGRPWSVTRLGARMELQFLPLAPRNADDVRQHASPLLESLMHLYMLNRGVLLTPFHGMMLCSPATETGDVDRLLNVFEELLNVLPQA